MNWFKKDTSKEDEIFRRLDELTALVSTTQQELVETKAELDEANSELEVYRKQEEADDAKRNGTEPWVEIKGDSIDSIKGIQIELDWNDAFIQYLKDNGLQAKDDDSLVQKWLTMLYMDLIDGFEQKIIDESDIIGLSEFE